MDGQTSRRVTDLSSTDASGERQTSFFERGLRGQGQQPVKDNSQTPFSDRTATNRHARKQTAPRFVSAPQGKIAEQGDDVFLDAVLDSYPPADIAWSKNGVRLVPDGDRIAVTGQVNKTRLDVRRLTADDGGHYTCEATNAAGGTSCTTDIIVKSMRRPIRRKKKLSARGRAAGTFLLMPRGLGCACFHLFAFERESRRGSSRLGGNSKITFR